MRERKSAEMLERIQRAAFELAREQGFDNTTVEQIAARADVAPRTIYAHYPTKESIVFAGQQGKLGRAAVAGRSRWRPR